MAYQYISKDRLVALKIVIIYVFFSTMWIYMSDTLLGVLVPDPAAVVRYSVLKGLAFITATGFLLYYLIARYSQQNRQAEETLKRLNEELESRVAERTEELERRNKELQAAYHGLEEETTKRVQAIEELRRNEQMLIQQSRMAAMGEMLANIAHHWRQPLNVAGLKIQQIGLAYDLSEFSRDFLHDNIAGAMEILQHLSRTIDEFQVITAPDREKSLFSVSAVIANMMSLTREGFREAGVVIEAKSSDDPHINGYPNEFSHALVNILNNARDAFLERRTADARIIVRSWTEQQRAVVTITDNAGGIKEEIMGRIFDAYFTTKDLGKGSGVGLFIAKTLIERNMGGRLTVRNVDGGAEFRIEV